MDLRCARHPDPPPDPGLYEDVPFESYCRWAAVSQTALGFVRQSPMHARAYLDGELDRQSSGFDFGKLLHALLLEPERDDVVPMPDFGTMKSSKNRERRDQWLEEQRSGVIIASEEEVEQAHDVLLRMRTHHAASQIIGAEGRRELSMVWLCPQTGLACKGRLDIELPEARVLVDVKTTRTAARWAFASDVAKYNYHVQAAWYLWGYERLTGERYDWLWLAAEKSPPYACAVYTPDWDLIRTGRIDCSTARDKLAKALRTGQWPGYGDGVLDIELPAYAVAPREQDDSLDGVA